MIALTIPEIQRLLAALTTRPLPPWLIIHWDARTPPPPSPLTMVPQTRPWGRRTGAGQSRPAGGVPGVPGSPRNPAT
jgi:hypothetical protein